MIRSFDLDLDAERTIAHAIERSDIAGRVSRVERRPSPYASTARLDELDVRLDDGRELRLMLKDLRPAAVLAAAKRARPAELCVPAREPLVYARLLGPARLGCAECLSAGADRDTGCYYVLSERVEGLQLCHVGAFERWESAARWLARLHVRLRDRARTAVSDGSVPLLVYDAPFYAEWLRRAVARVMAHEPDGVRRRAFGRLATRYEHVIGTLASQPSTFLHGEYYASNVIVRDTPGSQPICPVDWEMSALGPGALDLAALVSGDWTDDERGRLLTAYLDALREAGASAPSRGELEACVDCCRLQLAVQLLAWGPEWDPPSHHARDWLGEAVALASRLGC